MTGELLAPRTRGLTTPTNRFGEPAQGEGFRLEQDALAHDALLPRMTPAALREAHCTAMAMRPSPSRSRTGAPLTSTTTRLSVPVKANGGT